MSKGEIDLDAYFARIGYAGSREPTLATLSAIHLLSNHPDSPFVTNLIAARPDAGRRYALRNNELAVHHLNGPTDRRVLASAAELRSALEEVFHLTLPDAPELRAVLERVTGTPDVLT